MAGVTPMSQFPCKIVSATSSRPNLSAKFSNFSVNLINFGAKKSVRSSKVIIGESTKARRSNFTLRASYEEEVEPENFSSVVALEEPPVKEPTEIDLLKKQLVDSFYGTNRGLSATSETRAEIVELITQLEARNPTPAPTAALTLLNGKWILAILVMDMALSEPPVRQV